MRLSWLLALLVLGMASQMAGADVPETPGLTRIPASERAKFTLEGPLRQADQGGVLLLPRTCRVECQFMLSADGYTHYGSPSPVAWDWNHLPTTVKFRAMDSNPKTVSLMWQVSKLRFGDSLSGWQQPPGLVASGLSPKSGESTLFGVDFAQFAPLPSAATPRGPAPRPAATPRNPFPRLIPRVPLPGQARKQPPPASSPADASRSLAAGLRRLRLVTPMTFYVRAVPLDSAGNPVGYASLPVEVLWGPQSSGEPIQIQGPPPANHPVVRLSSYSAIRFKETLPYHLLAVQDIPDSEHPIFRKGTVYDLEPRPENLTPLEQIEWFLKQSVNGWSICYAAIQDSITYIASYVFYEIDPTVGDKVREVEQAALVEGMSQLGLPAALPNYDQLIGLGEDYLVEYIASEADIPPEVAKAGVDLLKKWVKSQCEGGGNPAVSWVPAPDYAYRPAYLALMVSNPGPQPTTPMDLVVRFGPYTPDWKDIGDMTGYYYPDGFKSQQVFADRTMHLPSLRPRQRLRVVVFLKETYDVNKETQNLGDALTWSCWAWGYHREQSLSISTRLLHPSAVGPANVRPQDSATWLPDTSFTRPVIMPR